MIEINIALVKKLINSQFPVWRHLSIAPVDKSGWDNRTFHLGTRLLVRLPSAAEYAVQVEKEQKWLPILAPKLPLAIPAPVALGRPQFDYPFHFSIYRWIQGEPAASANIQDKVQFAKQLANFLQNLQNISIEGGPRPGLHSFYRGGSLQVYSEETKKAISSLGHLLDKDKALLIWNQAIKNPWLKEPVWVHGDISSGNLLVNKGGLCGVIDFGQLAVGDPSCDLAIAWTFFQKDSREFFFKSFNHDDYTWLRARAWALWKALIVAAGFSNPNNSEAKKCLEILKDILG